MLVAQGLIVDVRETVHIGCHAQGGCIDDKLVLPQDLICQSVIGVVAFFGIAADQCEGDAFLFQHILDGF